MTKMLYITHDGKTFDLPTDIPEEYEGTLVKTCRYIGNAILTRVGKNVRVTQFTFETDESKDLHESYFPSLKPTPRPEGIKFYKYLRIS